MALAFLSVIPSGNLLLSLPLPLLFSTLYCLLYALHNSINNSSRCSIANRSIVSKLRR
jgi:hypothetical protein